MDRPSFSIVMPTYQRRAVVCDAVRALGRIRYSGDLEAIIVVDGSTDGTAEALAGLRLPFPVQVISQPNRGLSRARNRGAEAASGDILLFLDDDMMVDPEIVEQHARSHLNGADVVLGDIPLDPDSPPGFLSAGVGAWAVERRKRLMQTSELGLFDLIGGQLSIPRTVFAEVGRFDTEFTRGGSFGDEDLDLGVRLVGRYRVVFNPEAISYQRYVVGYDAHLRQWFQSGMADVAFARKHPDRAGEIFDLHGASRPVMRRAVIPVARVPGLAKVLGSLASRLMRKADRSDSRLLNAIGRRLFLLARELGYWRGVHLAGGIPRARAALVLCYHAIGDLSSDPVLKPYAIPPAQFERQIRSLLRRGYRFVGGDEFAAYLRGNAGLPRRPVLLTFDDCYEDLLSAAAPILEEQRIPAIAFAVTGLASNTNEWDQRNGCTALGLLDAQGLRAAAGTGIEIGAHSRTHRALKGLNASDFAREVNGSAEDIEATGLPRPRFFAYPYGEFDHGAREAVKTHGYAAAFSVIPGRFARGTDPFSIPRVEIMRQDKGLRFWLKTALPALSARLFPQP